MNPTLKILYGPPGTGKTWLAARQAVRLIDGGVKDEDLAETHRSLVAAGRIVWVTFHPSYTYEDFVEGFRPVVKESGITYEPKSGPFRIACDRALHSAPARAYFRKGQVLESSTHQKYEVVQYDEGAVVLENVKGKGEGLYTPVSFWVVERVMDSGLKAGDLSVPGTDHDKKKDLAAKVGIDMQTLFSMTGPLRAVWEELEKRGRKPAKAKAEPVVLVIDEINRADLARVFGELITLLEADKRLGAPEERRLILPYSQELFGVPASLHIIGTMNTADRSLTLIDHAFRRRFDFEEVPPSPQLCARPYADIDIPAILTAWNRRITALLNRDQQIGHSYLMKQRLEGLRTANNFGGTVDGELRATAEAIRLNMLPLLLEYFHDDWRKVNLIFGRDYSKNKGGLLDDLGFKDLENAAADLVDLADVSDFRLPDYWDPRSAAFDAPRFRVALNSVLPAAVG